MNPLFQALTGIARPLGGGMNANMSWMANGPLGAVQNVIQQAQRLAGSLQNPQEMVKRYFPDAPAEVTGDPEQLLGWLQQTGKVNPQMVQTARQMIGRR